MRGNIKVILNDRIRRFIHFVEFCSFMRQIGKKRKRHLSNIGFLRLLMLNDQKYKSKMINVALQALGFRDVIAVREIMTEQRLWVITKEICLEQEYMLPQGFSEDPIIVDCGANIGFSVAYFKMVRPDAKIIAYEPDRDCFRVLQALVKDNDWVNVEIHNAAVSDKKGSVDFYSSKLDRLGGSITKRKQGKDSTLTTYRVDAASLSDLDLERIDLLKIDIEGAEHALICNDSAILNIAKYVFIEYHKSDDWSMQRFVDIVQVLADKGFSFSVEQNLSSGRKESFFESHLHQNKSLVIFASQQQN